MTLDVFTFGEAMIRLSTPAGNSLETAPAFEAHTAGAEANVASALARLDRSVAWASRLPDSALGRRVLSDLRAAGVDCSNVSLDSQARMGTYFVDIQAPPRATSVIYDRSASAVCRFGVDDVDWDLVAQARVVHLTGITPALSQSLREAIDALAATVDASDALLSFDVNYRAKLWSPDEAAETISPLLQLADIVVCGKDDARDVLGIDGAPAEVAARLAEDFSSEFVVVTGGAEGAWWSSSGDFGFVPSVPVAVIDRLGAGDAFTAGLIDGLLDGEFADGVARGTALAAVALTTRGDQVQITREEMLAMVDGFDRDVDR